MICAILVHNFQSYTSPLQIGFVSSLATKLSDTTASEIGKAYGKTTYLITTLRRVPKGTEGAVSLDGTIAGVFGSLAIAIAASMMGLMSGPLSIAIALIAAFVATTAESFIGAIFQDKISWLTNEMVNFINTLIGAAVGISLAIYFKV